MARLGDTGVGNLPPFVKPVEVAEWDHFTMINASLRHSNIDAEKIEVVFTLRFDGQFFTLTMTNNAVRGQFVKHFQSGGEPITNLRLVKGNKAKPGQSVAWLFQDDGSSEDEELPDIEELTYENDGTVQYQDVLDDVNDIPF